MKWNAKILLDYISNVQLLGKKAEHNKVVAVLSDLIANKKAEGGN